MFHDQTLTLPVSQDATLYDLNSRDLMVISYCSIIGIKLLARVIVRRVIARLSSSTAESVAF